MAENLSDILSNALIGATNTLQRATVAVEWEKHPKLPGLTKYRLSGHLRESVQAAIDSKMRLVEDHPHGGCGEFLTPTLGHDRRWTSTGTIMLYPAPEQVPA